MVRLGNVAPLEGERKSSLVAFSRTVLVASVTPIASAVASSPSILMIWGAVLLATGTPSLEEVSEPTIPTTLLG